MLKEYTLNLREEEFDILLEALKEIDELHIDELRRLDCHTDEYLKACHKWADKSVTLMIIRNQLILQNM